MSTPQRKAARTHLIELMLQGFSFQKAAVQVQVEPPIKQAMAYRLTQRFRSEGQQALVDGRHGHPFKVRGEILGFIRERCTANPLLSSPTLQHELLQRFDCSISTSQLNRVRARFSLSNPKIQPSHPDLTGPDHTQKHPDLTLKKTKTLK